MSCSFVLSTSSASLEPRCRHVAVVHKQNVYLYGGMDSNYEQFTQHIWIYASISNTWTQHNTTGETPTHTIQSTATIITNNNTSQLVLFGGSDGDYNYSNDIHILNFQTYQWKQMSSKGTKPRARCAHVQWSTPTVIVVFGGRGLGVNFNDIHQLDIASMTWTQPSTFGEPPSHRAFCSYTKKGNEGFVFGGHGKGAGYHNDLHAFNLVTNTWRLLNTHGPLPPGRQYATMNTVRCELFICGGEDDHDDVLSDCWAFNTEKEVWRKLGNFDGRCGHTACEVGDKVLVFGGEKVLVFGEENTSREIISSLGHFSFT